MYRDAVLRYEPDSQPRAFGSTQQAWCTVPGHKTAGMILTIKVTGSAAAAPSPSASRPAPRGGTASSADAAINSGSTPTAGWKPFNASLAAAPAATIHHVILVAENKETQAAPGVTQDMWTFNGQVPAPVLRGHPGDEWVVTLVNHTDMDHSLDFHAASQPMSKMPEVAPGKSATMTFRTMYTGIYLYHCGTSPTLEHVANGMFGAMIIDPPNLAPAAHESVPSSPNCTWAPRASPATTRRCSRGRPTPWCSTAITTSTCTPRSRSRPASGSAFFYYGAEQSPATGGCQCRRTFSFRLRRWETRRATAYSASSSTRASRSVSVS